MVLSKVTYAIQLFGSSNLNKIQNKLDKILHIICNNENKHHENINEIRKKYNIFTLEQIYNMNWIKLSHTIYIILIIYLNILKNY